MRQILALQLKKFNRKEFPLYVIQVLNLEKRKELNTEEQHVLWKFIYVFLEEVPVLSTQRDIDFSIDFIPGAILASKLP
jgi:hypothetical protein